MNWGLISIVAVAVIVLFFTWASRRTSKAHVRFHPNDVEEALAELVSPDARDHDTWDLFLAWPIDDPYLESIRQRSLTIVRDCPPRHAHEDISEEGAAQIAALLQELRSRNELLHRRDFKPEE